MTRFLVVCAVILAGLVAVTPRAEAASIKHVVLIAEENHSQSAAMKGMPYLVSLGRQYAHTTNLKAITHPSLPNYFALTSGHTVVNDDCGSGTNGCRTGLNNIFHQAGSNWAQWSESMPSPCSRHNARPYVVHHAIPPFYSDLDATCRANDVPLNEGNVPAIRAAFTFVTPNLIHDAHDGSLGMADGWLKKVIPQLLADPSYKDGSTLIEVTFDEGSHGDNTVFTVFIHPSLHSVTVTRSVSHYSTLRLNERLLGFRCLGAAAAATPLNPALGL